MTWIYEACRTSLTHLRLTFVVHRWTSIGLDTEDRDPQVRRKRLSDYHTRCTTSDSINSCCLSE